MEIPEGFGQVNWFWNCGSSSRKAQTTFGVQLGGEVVPTGLVAWHSAAMNDLMTLTVFDYWIDKITLQVGGGGPTIEAALDHHGGGGGNGVSAAVSVLLRKHTASGGRANRGRMYFPGVEETSVGEDGSLLAAAVTDYTDAAASLLTDEGNIVGGVVLHDGPAAPTLITSITCESIVATQRRRQRR